MRKNWLPSLVKNLEPLAVMVGIACTMLAKRPRTRKNNMCAVKTVEKALRKDSRMVGDNSREASAGEMGEDVAKWWKWKWNDGSCWRVD